MKCISYFADAFQLTSGHSAIGKKKKKHWEKMLQMIKVLCFKTTFTRITQQMVVDLSYCHLCNISYS